MGTVEVVGRDAVLLLISDALAAPADRGEALLLIGEPGIGKTTCLAAAAARARDTGHLVLGTAGSRAEIQLPFAGLQRLLRPLLASTGTLPEVRRGALLTALGMEEGGPNDLFLVSVATLDLLRTAAEQRGLMVTADEFQWLDQETRHVLAFVTRRMDRDRVVVVATSSSVEGLPELRDVFREVRLPRLDEPAARRIVGQHAPRLDYAQRDRVVKEAVGNPLALVELATLIAVPDATQPDPTSPGPSLSPTLKDAFGGRVQDLSQLSRNAVLIAAVALEPNVPEVLAAAAVLSGHDVTAAILEAPQSLGVLSFDETRVSFNHPLAKMAIAQNESVSRRQAAHRALGAIITVNAYRRAWHRSLGTAEHDNTIAAELEAATSECLRRDDTRTAIVALERAAQLSAEPAERGRRLLLAAKHARRLGQPGLVLRLLTAATSGELSAFDRTRADLLDEDFHGAVIANSNRALQLCRVARHASAVGETDLALELAIAASRRRCVASLDRRAVAEVITLAGALARDGGDARAVAVLALADPIGNGRAVLSKLTEMDQDTVVNGDSLSAYAVAARAVGHYADAAKYLDRAEIEFRAQGLFGSLAPNLCVAAEIRLDLGEWDRAAAALAEFASLPAGSMFPNHRVAALVMTARTAALRGDISTALELVSQVEHSPAARSGSRYLAQAQIVRGIAYISAGKHPEANAALSRLFDPLDSSHHFREQFGAVSYLAESAVRTGEQCHADDVVERMQVIAETSGSPTLLEQLAYARAVLASDDVAEQHFVRGLASASAESLWGHARLELAYGRWLRRQHRVTQSRGPLQASLTTFTRLGAIRWAEEARDELEASGVSGEDGHHLAALSRLSAQELKIARLAAQGLNNREIGQQLSLSPRTVGSHLYRMFPKLGVSTRAQIAARIASVSK